MVFTLYIGDILLAEDIDIKIIDFVLEEIETDIKTCGVMTNNRPRKDCGLDCRYRKICEMIFLENDKKPLY